MQLVSLFVEDAGGFCLTVPRTLLDFCYLCAVPTTACPHHNTTRPITDICVHYPRREDPPEGYEIIKTSVDGLEDTDTPSLGITHTNTRLLSADP